MPDRNMLWTAECHPEFGKFLASRHWVDNIDAIKNQGLRQPGVGNIDTNPDDVPDYPIGAYVYLDALAIEKTITWSRYATNHDPHKYAWWTVDLTPATVDDGEQEIYTNDLREAERWLFLMAMEEDILEDLLCQS